ncbi:hypothetical protein E2320_019854 [Naja naja]|nr:hypothetical protein E2320_019854 [Naja naja]
MEMNLAWVLVSQVERVHTSLLRSLRSRLVGKSNRAQPPKACALVTDSEFGEKTKELTLILSFFASKGNSGLNSTDWEQTQQKRVKVNKKVAKELLTNLNDCMSPNPPKHLRMLKELAEFLEN